jgi:putative ABC transport system permease protein
MTLLITLFLRDRRHEIGIYIALGEGKGKIILQMLIEVFSVSIVAITLALFAGNALSGLISNQMLEQELLRLEREDNSHFSAGTQVPVELQLFNPGTMSVEELIAAYDTSLDAATIFLFANSALLIIAISTVVPIIYVVRLSPKKILM